MQTFKLTQLLQAVDGLQKLGFRLSEVPFSLSQMILLLEGNLLFILQLGHQQHVLLALQSGLNRTQLYAVRVHLDDFGGILLLYEFVLGMRHAH